jgi:hypothetical protein
LTGFIHIHTHAHTHTHTHTHAHTHACTHTHTRTRTCMHTSTWGRAEHFCHRFYGFWNNYSKSIKTPELLYFAHISKCIYSAILSSHPNMREDYQSLLLSVEASTFIHRPTCTCMYVCMYMCACVPTCVCVCVCM